MSDPLSERLGELFKSRPWYKLPRLLSMVRLVEIRDELREEEPARHRGAAAREEGRSSGSRSGAERGADAPTAHSTTCVSRRWDAAGCRFGRNVPLQHTFPDTPNLLVPNPRHVSRELMTRDQFQPATVPEPAGGLVDPVHGARLVRAQALEDRAHRHPDRRRRRLGRAKHPRAASSVPDPAPAGSTRPPAYANLNSHWWDASQIYGCDADMAAKLRTRIGGKLRIEPTGLLPVDPDTGVHFAGFTDNWWIGLAMLHTLFTLEHNYLCDLLAHEHPDWDDEQLFRKAKLINSAVMAKIHTVEWTPAILPHPLIKLAMNVNWSGLAGEDRRELVELARRQRTARWHRRLARPTITARRIR